jgi:hypothetical protein
MYFIENVLLNAMNDASVWSRRAHTHSQMQRVHLVRNRPYHWVAATKL